MRKAMREDQIIEEKTQKLSERVDRGNSLLETWSKKKNIGEGLMDLAASNPDKARGVAFVLENQKNHLKALTETEISTAFQTTPQNVIRIVRLGYPNSVRGEIFLEWPMETARDSIFYLKPVYTASSRGAVAGNTMYESAAYRYASELEEEALSGTVNGINKTFTGASAGNTAVEPVRYWTVKILHNDIIVAQDDGAGNITGTELDPAATNTINYTTGAVTINFVAAPLTGDTVTILYSVNTEVSTNYTQINQVSLTLTDYQFRANPWPLGISWSKMTELLLGTTLKIDAEEALIRGAADELKKSLDFQALELGYRRSLANSSVTFNADFAAAGADSEMAHAQSITRYIHNAGSQIYDAIQRGGVTKMYGGWQAMDYITNHYRFKEEGRQPSVGAFKIGSLDNIDLYKVPASIVPKNEIVCVWKNDLVPEDVSIAFGTLIPLYHTMTLEYKEAYKETGLYSFMDYKTLNGAYLVRLVLTNLP